jgi:hypothetical protein
VQLFDVAAVSLTVYDADVGPRFIEKMRRLESPLGKIVLNLRFAHLFEIVHGEA